MTPKGPPPLEPEVLAGPATRPNLPVGARDGTIAWSPLARDRLCPGERAPTGRSESDAFADMLYRQESSGGAIIDAVAAVATVRG